MKTQDRILQIKSCEQMCYAGKAATAYFYSICYTDPSQLQRESMFRLRDIRDCYEDLETTYLIRLFAVFEVTVRDYWRDGCGRKSYPLVKTLLNRAASQCYMQYDVLSNAHSVRDYRNSLVHGGAAKAMTLSEARGYLCIFLSYLPFEW